ncbi:hypothetical protein WEH80_35525 [Actinomycetes bacterium KLBMP 9759]
MEGVRAGGGTARSVVLAALCALVTAVGHVGGGGTLPDLGILVVLLPMLAAVFSSFARRCRSATGTVATLGAGQLALHHLMELLHPAHVTAAAAFDPAQMVTMHALVTLVMAVALRYADAAVAAVRAAARRVLPRRWAQPPVSRPLITLAVPAAEVPLLLARTMATAVVRRGPPVGC